jgi:hypothetical protein
VMNIFGSTITPNDSPLGFFCLKNPRQLAFTNTIGCRLATVLN